ncbi:hypothetical protein GGU11DRAFT_693150 [Lentinula aff. detonsa]|nr:hypothetical protein GGU11DRAFT_693150 [Lentinula aff. detonsa]
MPLCNIYPEHVRQFSHFLKCSQVVMADGSACSVGSFFIGRNSSGSKYVGQLTEILFAEGSSAAFSHQAGSILVHVIDTSSEAPQYRMRKIVFTNRYILVNSTDMLCAVNVQHHCIGNQCLATASRPAYQERSQKGTEKVIEHQNQHNLMLNTCQMRNAALLSHFRIRSPTLNASNTITARICHEIDLRKVAKIGSKKTSRPSSTEHSQSQTSGSHHASQL